MPKKIMPGSVMYSRCEALSKKYLSGEMSWDDLMKQDPLMMYSKEFMNCVAGLCGVNPGTGKPIPGSAPKVKPEPKPKQDPEPDSEPESETDAEPNETATGDLDLELDEAEEAANGADADDEDADEDEDEETDPDQEHDEDDGDGDSNDSGDTGDAEEPEPMAWDMCHWCQQEPASAVVFTQVQDDGGEQRLMRCDHLCRSCADRYWEALRNVQFACMSAEGDGE